SSLVERRGWFSGCQTVLIQHIPLHGRRAPDQRCEFSSLADARIDGWFGHDLGRRISTEKRWVSWDAGDVYAYCDGATPKVVVPLKRQVGWLVVTERPAGVAVYDGKSGELRFFDVADVPGPAYPRSLAVEQRESLTATGSFGDWSYRRAVGWDVPDDSVRSGRDSEFTLRAGADFGVRDTAERGSLG
ncbi:MAG TPA: hypothetical protein VGR21_11935, partial [Cryptosporangiaceae bacterium]|nr:hypothetical protein [Cryptosporangiaceae bacterium]